MGELKQITMYMDGSCIGNPGLGSYGIIAEKAGQRKERSGGFRKTTNTRIEISAAILTL